MSTAREELKEALCRYTTDTLTYTHTVGVFCDRVSKWMLGRESALHLMMDIKVRADSIDLSFSHITQSDNKGRAMLEYMKSKFTQVTADNRRAELEKELDAALQDTLTGLEELHCFLEAVEKLAVTSLHVFEDDNPVLHLPKGMSLDYIQVVISAARKLSPQLLEFKRDATVFFLPKLQNVEVLSRQLDTYIQTTQTICEKLEKSLLSDCGPKMRAEVEVDLEVDLSEEDVQRMLDHINQLDFIRKDEHFRMVFLFQEEESCSAFIKEFSERQPRMLQFLDDLEATAVQLDSMNKGAKISSVAGSSVGAVGGVLSIVGFALLPVTAGVSLGLIIGGTALGITSGVNSAVTTATEIGVNCTQQKKANEVFKSFMEDVEGIQGRIKVTRTEPSQTDMATGVTTVVGKVAVVGKGIDALVDCTSNVKLLKSEELMVSAAEVALQEGKALRNVPRVAADVPDIGQAAVKGPLALTKGARVGLIAANALFLGMDVFFICKDSVSLSKGSETEVSQFIRARAALWRSEIDSWQKIHDSLSEGLQKSAKNEAVLETPFYPETEKKEHEETKPELPHDEVGEKVK
ncbi:uncharacterized protein V6R79_007041 [Siganus canaliculatus]